MFGFLNPGKHDLEYRSAYARCCEHQHLHYGVPSLRFHSFEAGFLYLCALDSGAIAQADLRPKECCKLQANHRILRAADRQVGQFCGSLSMLLASIKLHDDMRDGRGMNARLSHYLLKGRITKAYDYFNTLDNQFNERVHQFIDEHLKMERCDDVVSIQDYAEPTARAFSYVFGLMANLPNMGQHRSALSSIGRHIGSAIISADCAADWKRDRKRGQFNPLPNEEAVGIAVINSDSHLQGAAQVCCDAFGAESQAMKLLSKIHKNIELNYTCCIPCGDGAVAVDSNECSTAICGLGCCACICACFSGGCHSC